MAAEIIVVPREDWEIVKKYISGEPGEGVALIPQHIYDALSTEDKDLIGAPDAGAQYDFGGEADSYVDVVFSPNHLLLDHLRENKEIFCAQQDASGDEGMIMGGQSL